MVKVSSPNPKNILLIQPVGWTFLAGGVYFSLPLLKGYLENNGLNVSVVDLNIELSHFYKFNITSDSVNKAADKSSLNSLNTVYYKTEDIMKKIVQPFNATWDIQTGFNFNKCNLQSSKSIDEHSASVSPFDDFYYSTVINKIEKENPAIVGFTITVASQLLTAFRLIRLIRKQGYKGKILIGGNIITRLDVDIIKKWIFNLIDGAILFQGEKALIHYQQALEKNLDLGAVRNLIWVNNNKIIKNQIEYLKPTEFGRPSYAGIDHDKYWGNNYLPILGSRGCYYGKCTFCSIPYAYGNNGFLGNDLPSNVYQDILNGIKLTGIRNFKFVDEALHPTILRKLSANLIKNEVNCQFEGYARLDSFWKDSKFLKQVSDAGLKKVYIGLELINSNNRDVLNKSDSDKALDLLKYFNDYGIKTHLFTLFGFPGTGEEEAMDTIEFCLKNASLIDTIDIFPFYYARHTQVDSIDRIIKQNEDWTIEYDYKPLSKNVMKKKDVATLCSELEEVIWSTHPHWLHPVYRMYSPWQD